MKTADLIAMLASGPDVAAAAPPGTHWRAAGTLGAGLLASLLPKGPPHRDDVAAQLMMSERTLQRRLAEEGTSFTNLVDDTRRELARQSLSAGELSLKMLSFQLGFSEPSAFYRACKRWFGMAPSDIQHKKGDSHGMANKQSE